MKPLEDAGNTTANSMTSNSTMLEIVRNKNNMADLILRKRIEIYRRELQWAIVKIDQERLDDFEFLRKLKICESDKMSEFAS